MSLAIFNEFVNLKMFTIAETHFASVIVMLKRFRAIKRGLQNMVISEKWSCCRENDIQKPQFFKEEILNDLWWDNVVYILAFTQPIYEMSRLTDNDKSRPHLVYEMWIQ